jgi:GT2 family glycosyltransferase
MSRVKLSYIMVTHNRREALLKTLEILHRTTPLGRGEWEAWVVDNASTDGTVAAVREAYADVRVIERPTNEGVWARSYAFGPAAGEYLMLLDDDSYPLVDERQDAVSDSLRYLQQNRQCAAVVGKVVLPDGGLEACAMPGVMLSGAVCLRKSMVEEVGTFRPEFFRKAGEYDFSFRLWQKGWTVERFEDIVYRHDKVMTGRSQAFAHRMDLRNNLILVERYVPAEHRAAYRADYIQRYSAVARAVGCAAAARQAVWEGRWWRIKEAVGGRQTLSAEVFERLFEHEHQARVIGEWAKRSGVKRVAIADFAKTLYPTYMGCRRAGLEVVAIVDKGSAFAGLKYRGVPVVQEEAVFGEVDGVVLANVNPAVVERRAGEIGRMTNGPVLKLWEPRYFRGAVRAGSAEAA